MSNYDAVIIGAGHNGLVTAGYLAKAGRKVLVLERRSQVGGAAVTEELFPGYRFSACAEGSGYLAREVVRDLKLRSHGLELIPADPVLVAPQPDGSQLTIWRDAARTAAEIERFSPEDARHYPAFVELMRKISGVVGGLMRVVPPDLPALSWSDLRSLPQLAGPLRKLGRKNVAELLRVLPMPASDLLNEWFESEVLKGAIAANGIRNITWGPQEAGTAYTLLSDWATSDTGLFRSAGVIRGGIGALTQAIAASASSLGAEIRTDAPVAGIAVRDGRAAGVILASGEEISAKLVASNADARTTFLELMNPSQLDASFVRHVRNIKYRGSTARIHLALSELPKFTAIKGSDAETLLRSPIQIAPAMAYLQRAYDCIKYKEFSQRPYLDILIPSLSDPGLAPEGHHVMSITVKYAPYHLGDGGWPAQRDAFAEVVLDTLAEYAPKIRDSIAHRQILTPADIETVYGLPEGNPDQGEMTLDQFFHMRPIPGYSQYRGPVAGLYMCGASTHPGGGVTGLSGRNAAREILRDKE